MAACHPALGQRRLQNEPARSLFGPAKWRLLDDLIGARAVAQFLQPLRKRFCRGRAKPGYKFTSPHSITSSAPASSDGGMFRPSARAVLRLMTSSNLVGCWMGRSAGLAPRRIRPR